jgi:hypothetical protein
MLAAIAAVTLTAGLSLAAVAGPATADDTSTPAPVASSTATTDGSTPTSTPTDTPTPTATPTTAPSTTDPSTTDPAPAVAPITFAAAATTQSNYQTTTSYITVVWQMPSWSGAQSATWPQTYVSQTAESTETLDVPLPPTCGMQYQVDSYAVTKSDSTALTNFLAAAKAGTKLTNGADNAYLASGGWGHAYKLVQNTACPLPCIPDSQVSYTYDSSTNSGVITVPKVAGSSGVLCQAFYVTATSWKYTTNGVWPQVVDQVDHVLGTDPSGNLPISKTGTYPYAAAVRCGQGDIYASFTANDATLFPENDGLPATTTGYLDGPGNPLPEHFLHDMGFSGPNPTYVQQNTSCYSPTTETGTATSTSQVCTGSNITGTNTLTLSTVPGGVWTVKDGSHYSKTYPIGFGGDATPSYIRAGDTYTITLVDGSSSDTYSVTPYSSTWTPQDSHTLDCNIQVTPVGPTITTNQQCNVDGSITIPTTAGVVYYLGSDKTTPLTPGQVITGSGSYKVIAEPAGGYEFPGDKDHQIQTWWEKLGDKITCDVTVGTGTCTVANGTSTVPVWVTLDNSKSSLPSKFEVTIPGTSYDTTFTVAAHHVDWKQNIGTSGIAGETINVLINGVGPATVLTVPAFTDCFPTTVIPADPSVTQATCNTATNTVNNNASLSVDLEAGLTYTVSGPAGFTTLTNLTGTTGQTIVATGIPAGGYTVTVAALSGFTLNSAITAPTWPFTISVVNPVCGSIGNISATALAADCPQSAATGFTAATTGVPTITVTLNPNVVYTAHESLSNTNTVLTQTTTDVPAGEYTINVTLSTAGSAAGFVIPPADQSFGPFDLTAFCPPTLPAWHVGASGTNAVCTDGSTTDGVINLVHLTGQVPDETGKVTYTITNTVTNATIYSGNIATAVNVPAGSYNVHATVPAGDGISGNTGTNPYEDISVVIGSSSTNCDPSRLAFTGGTIAWFGFVLAGGMLFLGIAFLLMRRRGNRTAE